MEETFYLTENIIIKDGRYYYEENSNLKLIRIIIGIIF